MNPETEKIIKNQLEILPEEIRSFFADPKINEQILEIGKTYNFDAEKLEVLQTETTLLILGLTNPDNYPSELKNRLKINDETSNDLVKKVIAFISIEKMEKLKEIYKKTEDENRKKENRIIEKIKGELNLLPKEKQEAINNFEWEKISAEIGKNHNLSEEEKSALKIEVALVLVELEYKGFLELNIEDNVGVKEDESKKISKELSEKIFKPIAEKLTEIIKKDLKNKSIHWQQNLDFILSGGDYTAFIREPVEIKGKIPEPKDSFNLSKIDDLKSRFTI